MSTPVIVDIRRRSRQGATQPFLCRADDGQQYWVKGAKAGHEALCAEWIAGRLGQLVGLPIPEVAQVVVPEEFASGAVDGFPDLGPGVRFGSRHVESAQEYDESFVTQTDEVLRQQVLVFDVWIRNTDRTFSRPYNSNGNPNLLWCTADRRLCVIDHNNAFLMDDLYQPSEYGRHVFADQRARLTAEFKADMLARMIRAADGLDAIMAELPVEWRRIEAETEEPHRLTAAEIKRIIQTPLTDQGAFWQRVEGVS